MKEEDEWGAFSGPGQEKKEDSDDFGEMVDGNNAVDSPEKPATKVDLIEDAFKDMFSP